MLHFHLRFRYLESFIHYKQAVCIKEVILDAASFQPQDLTNIPHEADELLSHGGKWIQTFQRKQVDLTLQGVT